MARLKTFEGDNFGKLMAEVYATQGKEIPEEGSRWASSITGNAGTVKSATAKQIVIEWDLGDIYYIRWDAWETYMVRIEEPALVHNRCGFYAVKDTARPDGYSCMKCGQVERDELVEVQR